jgi:hypothetical protein
LSAAQNSCVGHHINHCSSATAQAPLLEASLWQGRASSTCHTVDLAIAPMTAPQHSHPNFSFQGSVFKHHKHTLHCFCSSSGAVVYFDQCARSTRDQLLHKQQTLVLLLCSKHTPLQLPVCSSVWWKCPFMYYWSHSGSVHSCTTGSCALTYLGSQHTQPLLPHGCMVCCLSWLTGGIRPTL